MYSKVTPEVLEWGELNVHQRFSTYWNSVRGPSRPSRAKACKRFSNYRKIFNSQM